MKSGIYRITSPTGRMYIGQSKNIRKRWYNYNCLDCVNQRKLYNSLKKHGPKAHKFEVLLRCPVKQLNEAEKYYIAKYDTYYTELGMNLTAGGDSHEITPETRKKMSLAMMGNTNGATPCSRETKAKISAANRGVPRNVGRVFSAETLAKISGSNIGRKSPNKTKSKYIGLSWQNSSNKWRVRMRVAGKSKHIGYFTDERLAAKAYDAAAIELYGSKLELNFP